MIGASGPKAAELAGRLGDGLISTSPDKEIVQTFQGAGGKGPIYGQMTVCWAESDEQAVQTAHEIWPNSAIPGELGQELPTPAHFEQAAQMVKPEDIAKQVTHGPNAQPYLEKIDEYIEAGFDHVYLHQIGPDQEGFIRFCESEILPRYMQAQRRAA
jgi:G6PDH family F420-dependent oxidoreductase